MRARTPPAMDTRHTSTGDDTCARARRPLSVRMAVLIPDIYKGKKGVDVEEAHHLMSNLDFPNAVTEIGAAAAFLKEEVHMHMRMHT